MPHVHRIAATRSYTAGLDSVALFTDGDRFHMDRPLSLDEIRTAVDDLAAALINHQALSDKQWDEAIATLGMAREQHGGRIRRLIHIVLDAGHTHRPSDLHDGLTELHCHLALADDPPPPPQRRRNRRPRLTPRYTQLELFTIDPPQKPPVP